MIFRARSARTTIAPRDTITLVVGLMFPVILQGILDHTPGKVVAVAVVTAVFAVAFVRAGRMLPITIQTGMDKKEALFNSIAPRRVRACVGRLCGDTFGEATNEHDDGNDATTAGLFFRAAEIPNHIP